MYNKPDVIDKNIDPVNRMGLQPIYFKNSLSIHYHVAVVLVLSIGCKVVVTMSKRDQW